MNMPANFKANGLRPKMLVACLALSALLPSGARGDLTNRYVVKGNPGALFPYDTLAKAAASIQTAIDYAYAGETVLVAAATYDAGGTNMPGRALTNRVYIWKNISVCSLDNNPASTIIKGNWDPASTNGPAAVRCVLINAAGASLNGFTLNGGATLAAGNGEDMVGGGIMVRTSPSSISNCIISANAAYGDGPNGVGGGGACYGNYFNCSLVGNRIGAGRCLGGGAFSATLSNCVISGNTATEVSTGVGGGAARGTLYGCLVSNNTASSQGGGIYGWSQALPCIAHNCTIVTNTASLLQGGGAGSGNNQYSVILSNCTVAFNNAGGVGGGVDLGVLFNCLLVSNRSAVAGGGTSRSMLTNCIVAHNINGGSRFDAKVRNSLFYGNNLSAIYVRNGDIIENCTFVGNNTGISLDQAATVAVVNCISYSNTVNWTTNSVTGALLAFSNSCTFPEYPGWHASNITNEPLFMAYGSGYGITHVPGNYRLQAGSPCVDSGMYQAWMAGAVDLDGLPRILKGTVDMGAYEEAHVFNHAPPSITNTVMRGFSTNLVVYLTNSSPDLALYWGSSITSLWASGPNSGAPLAAPGSGTLTVTNDSYGMALGTFVSRMIVSALTNYPLAMEGYSQTGAVDMVLHVAEFARNPTQVVATVR
ncbi:MAG: right-handed parallel beta-helix repeat-containing protein, partial [Kiritimatiellia bacterium]